MKKKIALVLASLLILTVTLTSSYYVQRAYAQGEEHRYIVMGGEVQSDSHLSSLTPVPQYEIIPFFSRPPYYTPLQEQRLNITFSDPDPVTGVVNLTVPAGSYVGLSHTFLDINLTGNYYKIDFTLSENGYGWLFTGTGSNPVLGDVDYYVFNNITGVYFFGPDGLHSSTSDATWADDVFAGPPLQTGPDGIPGTLDDYFGTKNFTGVRTPDPPGSSVLYIPTTITVDYWIPDVSTEWALLYSSRFNLVLTTATAYDVVIDPTLMRGIATETIDGRNGTRVGKPVEFLAGIEHPPAVSHGHAKWNAYATYACVWSDLNISTTLGPLDLIYRLTLKIVREDSVIADINSDEIVDIFDIVICAAAFGAKDEGFGRPEADPNFDARADLMSEKGTIDIFDLVRIAGDFGAKLTKDCIIRP